MRTYTAVVTQSGKYWDVFVPEIDRHTQARTLREVEDMASDLIKIMSGSTPDSVDVVWPPQVASAVEQWVRASNQIAAAERDRGEVVGRLKNQSLSIRDSGHLLGLSYKRVQQMLAAHKN